MDFKKNEKEFSFSLPNFLQIEGELQEVNSNSITPELSALDLFASKEQTEEKDFDNIKRLYPKTAQSLLSLIEDICDKMEYNGSMMYDEYPDKISIQKICDSHCKEKMDFDSCSREELLQVLLLQEMYYRRCRYRRRNDLFHRQ
ncbi:MAG: hypothetical protein ACI4F9_06355 [Lachnospiraceae bacterium]